MSVLARTIARTRLVRGLDAVIVATDDERIADEARREGAAVKMTSPAHVSGSDRVGEVVCDLHPAPDFVLNLQADEPFFAPRAIERLLGAMRARPDAIWTLADPITDPHEFLRSSVVKAVLAVDGRALYFSRAPVPYDRTRNRIAGDSDARADRDAVADRGVGAAFHAPAGPVTPSGLDTATGLNARANLDTPAVPDATGAQIVLPLRHVGVYGYPRELLAAFLALPPGRLELREGLEQLRALEHGLTIRVLVGAWPDPGVDTPEDAGRLLAKYPTPEAMDRAGLDGVE